MRKRSRLNAKLQKQLKQGADALRGDYEVGYGKPPKGSQFKKGISGNPSGRPKGSKNRSIDQGSRLLEIITKESYRSIKVNERGKQVELEIAEAIVRSTLLNAAKGDHKSQRLASEMMTQAEEARKANHLEFVNFLIEYKIRAERTIELCRLEGRKPPNFIPHPRQIVLDFRNNEFAILGPISEDDKVNFQEIYDALETTQLNIEGIEEELAKDLSEEDREILEEALAREKKFQEDFRNYLPDE